MISSQNQVTYYSSSTDTSTSSTAYHASTTHTVTTESAISTIMEILAREPEPKAQGLIGAGFKVGAALGKTFGKGKGRGGIQDKAPENPPQKPPEKPQKPEERPKEKPKEDPKPPKPTAKPKDEGNKAHGLVNKGKDRDDRSLTSAATPSASGNGPFDAAIANIGTISAGKLIGFSILGMVVYVLCIMALVGICLLGCSPMKRRMMGRKGSTSQSTQSPYPQDDEYAQSSYPQDEKYESSPYPQDAEFDQDPDAQGSAFPQDDLSQCSTVVGSGEEKEPY